MTKLIFQPTLSLFINNAYKEHSFVSAFIYGAQGVGKTTYGLKTLYYVYGSWKEALDNTYFYIDDLLPRLREAFDRGERIKAILLDDAGVWLVKYYWRRDFSIWFSKFFNLMRTIISGIIFTSVEVTDIIKFVRDKVMYRVHVMRTGENSSEAIGYRVRTSPLLEQYVERIFEDKFTLSLPDNVRREYEAKRRQAITTLFQELERSSSKQLPIEERESLEREFEELVKSFQA